MTDEEARIMATFCSGHMVSPMDRTLRESIEDSLYTTSRYTITVNPHTRQVRIVDDAGYTWEGLISSSNPGNAMDLGIWHQYGTRPTNYFMMGVP